MTALKRRNLKELGTKSVKCNAVKRRAHYLSQGHFKELRNAFVKQSRSLIREERRAASRRSFERWEAIETDDFLNKLVGCPGSTFEQVGVRDSDFDLFPNDNAFKVVNNNIPKLQPNTFEIQVIAKKLHDELGGRWEYFPTTEEFVCVEEDVES
jgi:hypothetical protein